jgi:hypothetical protein
VIQAHGELVLKQGAKLVESARADLGDYDRVGSGQRFFDNGPKRPDMDFWKQPANQAAKKAAQKE